MRQNTSETNNRQTPDTDLTVNQGEPAYSRDKLYTVDDWFSWDESFRAELHDGVLIAMGQPAEKHQRILGEIFAQLHAFLKGKTCKVYPAPFGVRLKENEQTIFEPDIVVICDKTKTENGKICIGPPDLVIEILSPSTTRYDMKYKFNKYREADVPEYWIADPDNELVQVNILNNGNYITSIYDDTDKVNVTVLDGCVIDLTEVFAG